MCKSWKVYLTTSALLYMFQVSILNKVQGHKLYKLMKNHIELRNCKAFGNNLRLLTIVGGMRFQLKYLLQEESK